MFQTQKRFVAKWSHWIRSTPAKRDYRPLSRFPFIGKNPPLLRGFIFLTLPATLALTTGCTSAPPVRSDSVHQGQWNTKILVHDKVKSKSATLSMDATSVWPDRLRLDVTATLGISVMQLALNKTQISYVLPRQKKYFAGPVTDRAFSHIIHDLPLDPRWIIDLLFDRPIQDAGWVCKNSESKDSKPMFGECENDTTQIKVQVLNRLGERRLITVTSPRVELKIQIQDFSGDIHPSDALFTLTKPDDFVDISNK